MIDLYKTASHLAEVVAQTGYATINSLMFLHELVKEVQPKHIIELGTGYGCSTIFMALAGNSKITTIDDYRGDVGEDIQIVIENLYKCGVSEQVTLIHSNTCVFRGYKENAEIVFMDASHDIGNLKLEYKALVPVLAEDHVLIIDDAFSVNLEKFFMDLLKQNAYQSLNILKFHNGIAILHTNIDKYTNKINHATQRAQ